MILFIFEGAKYEPPLYDDIKALFFPHATDQIICSFCSSIYTFYKRLKDEFGEFADVVDVLKTELEKWKACSSGELHAFLFLGAAHNNIAIFALLL